MDRDVIHTMGRHPVSSKSLCIAVYGVVAGLAVSLE
jgi:hypothetical protein